MGTLGKTDSANLKRLENCIKPAQAKIDRLIKRKEELIAKIDAEIDEHEESIAGFKSIARDIKLRAGITEEDGSDEQAAMEMPPVMDDTIAANTEESDAIDTTDAVYEGAGIASNA